MCVDYKPLNAATKSNHYPLPFVDDILDEVANMRAIVCVMAIQDTSKLQSQRKIRSKLHSSHHGVASIIRSFHSV